MTNTSENQWRKHLEVRIPGSTVCSPFNSQGNNHVSHLTTLKPGHIGKFSHRENQSLQSRDNVKVATVKIPRTYA